MGYTNAAAVAAAVAAAAAAVAAAAAADLFKERPGGASLILYSAWYSAHVFMLCLIVNGKGGGHSHTIGIS